MADYRHNYQDTPSYTYGGVKKLHCQREYYRQKYQSPKSVMRISANSEMYAHVKALNIHFEGWTGCPEQAILYIFTGGYDVETSYDTKQRKSHDFHSC